MKNIFGIIVVALLISGCSPKEEQDVQNTEELPEGEITEKELQDEVMDIHDEVMPRMDELMMLKGELKAEYDSLMFDGDDADRLIVLKERIAAIEDADSAMMNWMRQFKAVADSVDNEGRIEYLENEKERITRVQIMMIGAIDSANAVVKQ